MDPKLKVAIKKPVTIRERVYRAIRNDILNGRFSPGTRMVESRLARQIKTSRTPIREALHMLEREGLLVSVPRVGYRVRSLDWGELEEICEIRAVNETLAARWAMERISPKDLQALVQNVAASEAAVRAGDPRSFVEFDAEFHEILDRASGSERLLELCQLLRRHMLRYRIDSLFHEETALAAIAGHRQILQWVAKKDRARLDTAIRDHLEWAKRSIQHHAFSDRSGSK